MDAKPLAISLFAGAGGCSLGFKRAGYNILYAIDINENAVETYRHNFPDTNVKWGILCLVILKNFLKI